MNLRDYYAKIRETEVTLPGTHVVLVSLATPDGGQPGVASEVPRQVAAKMLVDGSARLATDAEILEARQNEEQARRAAEQAASASRVQFTVISASDLKALRGQKTKD